MGKKKTGQRVQESFGNMVSKAALAQMGPSIERYVKALVGQLGQQLAVQQASTLETIFARVVVLEEILMEKYGYSKDDLATKVAETEDRKEGLASADQVVIGDVVRLEISTKTKDQTDYQGSSRLKVYETGTGQTLGNELENAIVGMNNGEEKEVSFGKDGGMTAKIKVERISRSTKQPVSEAPNADQAQG